jgi:hypothetical protein
MQTARFASWCRVQNTDIVSLKCPSAPSAQSILAFNVRLITLSGVLSTLIVPLVNVQVYGDHNTACRTYMTTTIAPQPEYASRSTALRSVWEMVSKRSSGELSQDIRQSSTRSKIEKRSLRRDGTYRSGSHSPSAIPNSFSDAVPETTKS